jgi:hypothetical protein
MSVLNKLASSQQRNDETTVYIALDRLTTTMYTAHR